MKPTSCGTLNPIKVSHSPLYFHLFKDLFIFDLCVLVLCMHICLVRVLDLGVTVVSCYVDAED